MAAEVTHFIRSRETGLAPQNWTCEAWLPARREIAEVAGAVWRIPRRADVVSLVADAQSRRYRRTANN